MILRARIVVLKTTARIFSAKATAACQTLAEFAAMLVCQDLASAV
jgi:hypothetical protein